MADEPVFLPSGYSNAVEYQLRRISNKYGYPRIEVAYWPLTQKWVASTPDQRSGKGATLLEALASLMDTLDRGPL